MPEFQLYEGLVFTTPKEPSLKDIRNSDLPKHKQKWVRTELPEDFDEWPIEQQEAFAFEEDKRCTDGFWFLNNGEKTYITGDHYHYLNWFQIDSGYPQYRDRDKRWFYHWALCDNDVNCLGQCYGKLRRDGYSYRVVSIQLNRARKTFNAKYGIVSKTGEDAKEMFQKMVHGFLEYPKFLKPQVQSAEDVKKALIFKTPQQRVTFKNRGTKKEISLNTIIDWKNTKENSYDGTKQKILSCDEAGKWEEVSIEKWFNIANTCCMLGGTIIGKLLMGSTVNESKKGGAGFRAIYDNSSTRNKTKNGRTLSGLWRYFVPAYDGLEGFIDEFGMSVIETPTTPIMGIDGNLIKIGAKEYLQNELLSRKEAGDEVGYYEQMRKFPITEDDMFRNPSDKASFDLAKIYEQIDYTSLLLKANPSLTVRGNFLWKNGVRDSNVVWHPCDNGKWIISWLPSVEHSNSKTAVNGKMAPGATHLGLFSLDPFDHKQTSDKKGSKAASHGFRKLDIMSPYQSNCFISQYWGRPTDPHILYEDMILQCVYYGWGILGESNKPGCINYFRLRGYDNYLINRPAITQTEWSEKHQAEVWIPTAGEAMRNTLIEHLAAYIAQHIGVNPITQEMGHCLFLDTLSDWAKFDTEKWTDYDLTVSSMIAVVGSQSYQAKKSNYSDIELFKPTNTKSTDKDEIKKRYGLV